MVKWVRDWYGRNPWRFASGIYLSYRRHGHGHGIYQIYTRYILIYDHIPGIHQVYTRQKLCIHLVYTRNMNTHGQIPGIYLVYTGFSQFSNDSVSRRCDDSDFITPLAQAV